MSENREMKQDFISGMTYRQIAQKYEKDEKEVRSLGRKEGWFRERSRGKTEKTNEELLAESTRRLCLCLERAIDEIDCYLTEVKVKEKSVDYDATGKKAVCEKITESEELKITRGLVDRSALKALIQALCTLKGEECISDEENGLFVIMSEDAKEYAK